MGIIQNKTEHLTGYDTTFSCYCNIILHCSAKFTLSYDLSNMCHVLPLSPSFISFPFYPYLIFYTTKNIDDFLTFSVAAPVSQCRALSMWRYCRWTVLSQSSCTLCWSPRIPTGLLLFIILLPFFLILLLFLLLKHPSFTVPTP